MALLVDVFREYDETGKSRLRACVVQEIMDAHGELHEIHGSDILVRRFTHVDSAMQRCRVALAELYKLIELPEVQFRVSADAAPVAKPKKVPEHTTGKSEAPQLVIPQTPTIPCIEDSPEPFAELP